MYSTLMRLKLYTVVHAVAKSSVYDKLNESENNSPSSTRFELTYVLKKSHTTRLVFRPWRVRRTMYAVHILFLLTLHITSRIFVL
jgi:hypothetical protein